jgi:DNA gyrase/topoisomerase IV subunit A
MRETAWRLIGEQHPRIWEHLTVRWKRHSEPDATVLLERAEDQLAIYQALVAALDRVPEVLGVIAGHEDREHALAELQELLNVSEHGAMAVTDLQFSRVAAGERRRLRERLVEAEASCERLRAVVG